MRDLAISHVVGALHGLKKNLIHKLEKLQVRRLDYDALFSYDLAESLCELSILCQRSLTLLVDDRGRVAYVVVGDVDQLHHVPQCPPPEEASTPLSDYYAVHTHIGALSGSRPTLGDQVTLLQYRFSTVVVLIAGLQEGFSQSHGEHPKWCDGCYVLRPTYDLQRESPLQVQIEGPWLTRNLEHESRESWKQWAHEVFQAKIDDARRQTTLPALMIGVHPPGKRGLSELEDTLAELSQLTDSCGYRVVGAIHQARSHPDGRTYLGQGKAEELSLKLQEQGIQAVVADDELSPTQQRVLEDMLRVPVLDRTEIILNIFAQRAQSREGKLQVELAKLQYMLPRLRGKGASLSQQATVGKSSGVTATRGPGETLLELERRVLRDQIHRLEKEVQAIVHHRAHQRQRRQSQQMPVVALVGYTNAGKSTLMKTLTGADVLVESKLFATLDPTTRKLVLPSGGTVLLSDTVGFIRKLPTALIKAFQGTLEEVVHADLILHVWDVSHPNRLDHYQVVMETLEHLGVAQTPQWLLCNKLDLLGPQWEAEVETLKPLLTLADGPPDEPSSQRPSFLLSALDKSKLKELLEGLDQWAMASWLAAAETAGQKEVF